MRRPMPVLPFLCALLALAVLALPAGGQQERSGPVHVIEVSGEIDPVIADWFDGRMRSAEHAGAAAVVVQLDTPGGLMVAMDEMVATMRQAGITVVTWVGPSGARATSAGAFLAAASDIIVMAPGTNIGSATPVSGGGDDLDAKVVNDSAASIAALAEETGHPPELFRQMVTEARNFTASEARTNGVADGIAPDLPAVLTTIDGMPARDGGNLAVADAPLRSDTLPWYLRVLQVLTDPNLIFLLLVVGVMGIMAEITAPGSIIPGAAGVIALLLAIAGLSALPFAWIGLALVLLAVGLFFAETHVPGFGALAGLGVVALALGGAFLFGGSEDGIATSLWVVIPTAALIGGGSAFAARRVAKAHGNTPSTGVDTLVGQPATVRHAVASGPAQVMLNGELWAALSADGTPLIPGQTTRVVKVDSEDLTVTVQVESENPKER